MTYASAKFNEARRLLLLSLAVAVFSVGQVHASGNDESDTPASYSNIGTSRKASAQLVPPKIRVSPRAQAYAPALGSSGDTLANFGAASGTEVGQRAIDLRDQVVRLRTSIANDANEFMALRANGATGSVQYHSTVAAITARLQNGTTRGNPILQRQWREAEESLNQVHDSLGRLNNLATAVATDASQAGFLLESIQASFQLSGAVDEDHDQLSLLRDEVSRLIVQTDYLHTEVVSDIQRQTSYLTTESTNLQTLSFAIARGEMFGPSLGNRMPAANQNDGAKRKSGQAAQQAPMPLASPAFPVTGAPLADSKPAPAPAAQPAPETAQSDESGSGAGKLLVLIRFNQDNVPFERRLSQAVATAIDRRPNAQFTIVAVAPKRNNAEAAAIDSSSAQRNADAVKSTLLQMGLSASRISMADITQSANADAPEVHVYVR
ncbi:MAG: hypothetical protein WBK91_01850 [Alphaproteobacteria bacterium]